MHTLKYIVLQIFCILASSHVIGQAGFRKKEPVNRFTLSHDNDILKITNQTDNYYSFGFFIGYHRALLKSSGISKLLPFGLRNKSKIISGVVVSQKGFTPGLRTLDDPTKIDRPFAGLLTANPYLLTVTERRLIKFTGQIGVRGPAASSGKTQNFVHRIIGDEFIPGWDNQLGNKVVANIYVYLVKPYQLAEPIELLSESEVALGNNQTYIQQGMRMRIGRFNVITNSGLYGTNIGKGSNRKQIEFYVTTGIFGQLSFANASLDARETRDRYLSNIAKSSVITGFDITGHMQVGRFDFRAAYHNATIAAEGLGRHSYGNLGIGFRW